MTDRILKGTVLHSVKEKRFPNTTVRIAAIVDKGKVSTPVAHANTDADGQDAWH